MRDLKIADTIYHIPQSWDDMTLKKFLQLRDHEKLIKGMDLLDYHLEYISIVCEIPIEDLLTLMPYEVNGLIKELLLVTTREITSIKDFYKSIDGITYVIDTDFNKMSLGQFIDLDLVTKEGDVWDNAHKITASFMRPSKITKLDKVFKKTEDNKIDKYSYEALLQNADIFYQKMPMTYIHTCISHFFTFRQNLTQQYEGLFPSTNGGEQIEIEEQNDVKTLEQIYNEKWNWYSVINDIAQGDLTRFEEITELNLIQVLNHLAFLKETNDLHKSLSNKGNVTHY